MWNVPTYRDAVDDPSSLVPMRSTRREIQVEMQGISMGLEGLGDCRSRRGTSGDNKGPKRVRYQFTLNTIT